MEYYYCVNKILFSPIQMQTIQSNIITTTITILQQLFRQKKSLYKKQNHFMQNKT